MLLAFPTANSHACVPPYFAILRNMACAALVQEVHGIGGSFFAGCIDTTAFDHMGCLLSESQEPVLGSSLGRLGYGWLSIALD